MLWVKKPVKSPRFIEYVNVTKHMQLNLQNKNLQIFRLFSAFAEENIRLD